MTQGQAIPLVTGGTSFVERDVAGYRVTDLVFPAGLRLADHEHDRSSFVVMLEGAFDLFMLRRTLPCPVSTVMMEPAGERHGNQVSRAGARVLVIQPDPDHRELPRPCASFLETAHHLRSQRLTQLGGAVARELNTPDAVSDLAIEGHVCEMLALGARLRFPHVPGRGRPSWLSRVEQLLHDRFMQPISLRDLSQEAGVHPVHLARVFRSHHGMSPGEYARELRLLWAASRLAESDDSVCDIGLQAGFADQSHFGRAFKRRMGLTPAAFRRTHEC